MGFFSNLFGRDKHHTYYTAEYDLEQEEIDANREEILSLLRSTHREGMDHVIDYLIKNDFFNVPASVHHHHRGKGGLAQHSLSVYRKVSAKLGDESQDSVIIAALLHDICKADKLRYDKKGGLHRVHGKGGGRGRRSVSILQTCGLSLTEPERRAIRWHMGGMNARPDEFDDVSAARSEKLFRALYETDCEDSNR